LKSSHPDTGSPVSEMADAGLWRRFMGAVYESVILVGVVIFFAYGYSALGQYRGEAGLARWVFQGFLLLVISAYFIGFWSEGRRSLPMKTVAVRLVDSQSQPLSLARATLRCGLIWILVLVPAALAFALHPAWLLLWALSFAWAAFSPQRQTLHDQLSGTRLIIDRNAAP
jgi:uncharacterized RDD family membrane protein YckC